MWSLRLLHLERLDETALGATRLGLSAWQLREELKRSQFDERFHLWELEAIRSIATGIGGILDTSTLAEELISHLVALLGVRSAHVYLGETPETAESAAGFGTHRLTRKELAQAWQQGIYTDDLLALPLQSDTGSSRSPGRGRKGGARGHRAFRQQRRSPARAFCGAGHCGDGVRSIDP